MCFGVCMPNFSFFFQTFSVVPTFFFHIFVARNQKFQLCSSVLKQERCPFAGLNRVVTDLFITSIRNEFNVTKCGLVPANCS